MTRRAAPKGHSIGFTLVELLIALAAMALLGLLAWRGIDGMTRAQSANRSYSADVQVLQASLVQWGLDLDALAPAQAITALDFDGQLLRLTRQYLVDEIPTGGVSPVPVGGGLRVVAWTTRDVEGRRMWLRWQSPLLHTRDAWEQAWLAAQWWGQNPTPELRQRELAIAAVERWQVFYYRNNSWTSALSSGADGQASPSGRELLPDGVRLELLLTPGQAISGGLTRDWVRPTLGPGGS